MSHLAGTYTEARAYGSASPLARYVPSENLGEDLEMGVSGIGSRQALSFVDPHANLGYSYGILLLVAADRLADGFSPIAA